MKSSFKALTATLLLKKKVFFSEAKVNKNEIVAKDLETTILRFLQWTEKNFKDAITFCNPIECLMEVLESSWFELAQCFDKLEKLGALIRKDCSMTLFGKMLLRLALPLNQAEFLLFGSQFHSFVAHFAVMTAFLSHDNIWLMPNHNNPDRVGYQRILSITIASRQKYCLKHKSDLLGAIEIFRDILFHYGRESYESWINENGFHLGRVKDFLSAAIEIIIKLEKCGFLNCKSALNLISLQKLSQSPLTFAQIDTILPMDKKSATICSLIVAWALSKNRIHTQEYLPNLEEKKADTIENSDQENANHVLMDTLEKETILMNFTLKVNGNTSKMPLLDTILRNAIDSYIPLNSDVTKTSIQVTQAHKNTKNYDEKSGIMRFTPRNVSFALQFLQSYIKENKILQYKHYHNNSVYECSIHIHSFKGPKKFNWVLKFANGHERKVYDYPVLSPLYCLPVSQEFIEENVKNCFVPCAQTRLTAVAASFIAKGNALCASLLSLISPEYLLCFAVVERFSKPADFLIAKNWTGQRYIVTVEFGCQNLQDEFEYDQAKAVLTNLSDPIVAMFKNWTKQDIIDEKRSLELCSLLQKLLDAVAKN